MPKCGHNYAEAKALSLKGLSLKQISDKLAIPYDTLTRYALRHKWTVDRTSIGQIVSATVTEHLQRDSVDWISRITRKARSDLDALEGYSLQERVNTLDPEQYVRVLDTLDKLARRNYGLDAETGSKTLVQVSVNPVGCPMVSDGMSVVDVDEVRDSPTDVK